MTKEQCLNNFMDYILKDVTKSSYESYYYESRLCCWIGDLTKNFYVEQWFMDYLDDVIPFCGFTYPNIEEKFKEFFND